MPSVNSQPPVCFLDLDGVLVDFLAAACAVHGRKTPYDVPEAKGIWDMSSLWGISPESFWEPIDSAGSDFWYTLDFMPWAGVLLEEVCDSFEEKNVYIMTAPGKSASSWLGKARFMKDRLPEFLPRFLIGVPKHVCARPGAVLIDDNDENISKFNEAGGCGILFPRPWNSLHLLDSTAPSPWRHVEKSLRDFWVIQNAGAALSVSTGPAHPQYLDKDYDSVGPLVSPEPNDKSVQAFDTGAIRDAQIEKARPDLISPLAMDRLGQWLRRGADHYGDRNWEKGIPVSRCFASLYRHVLAYQRGDQDEDHLAAIMCNSMFIAHYEVAIERGILPPEIADMPNYRPQG